MIILKFKWHCEICGLPSLGYFQTEEAANEGLKGHIDLWHPEKKEEDKK